MLQTEILSELVQRCGWQVVEQPMHFSVSPVSSSEVTNVIRLGQRLGLTALKRLSERIKKHDGSKVHMENCVKLAVFGKISIATQLDDGHRVAV